MRTSDNIKELITALVEFQTEEITIEMNKVNPFFNSRYADLATVIKAVKLPLYKHGLAITQFVTSQCIDRIPMVGVTTRLVHTSGQWMEETAVFPLDNQYAEKENQSEDDNEGKKKKSRGATPAQKGGINVTYIKRYQISSILNIYTEDDNDGITSAIDVSEEIASLFSSADKITQKKYFDIVKEFDPSGDPNKLSNSDLKKVLIKMKKV